MVKINCIGGIGDILFCEPIFKHFMDITGKAPLVYIHPHMLWIQDYIYSAKFTGEPVPDEFKTGSMVHTDELINLRYANQIYRKLNPHDHSDLENMMLDKYRLLGLSDTLWKSLKIHFNQSKGAALARELGVSLLDEYTLRNEYCQVGKIDIPLNKNKTVVDMRIVAGYNMLDWYLLHAQADGIHTVSTSTFFLMQALCALPSPWFSPEVYVYPRPNEDGLRGISQLKPDFQLILKP